MTITITTITGAAKSYIEIFFRRKWLVLAPTILLCGISLAYSFTIPSKYRTSTIILVEEEKTSNPLIAGLAVSTSVRDRLETIVKILLSRPLLEQVVNELNVDPALLKNPGTYDELIAALRNSISVQLVGRDILKVSSEDRDPVVCQKVANTITSLFIKHNLELQMKETNTGIGFLKNQRAIYEKKLKESERRLREFKERYQGVLSVRASEELSKILGPPGAGSPAPLVNTEVLRYTQFKGDLIRLNLDLKDLLSRKEKLLKQLGAEDQYIVSERVMSSVLKGLEADLSSKQVELEKLLVDATEQHPTVARLKKDIEDLKATIKRKGEEKLTTEDKEILNPSYQTTKEELSKTEREIESTKTRLKLTELYMEEETETIRSIPKREEELSALQRDYAINAGIYSSLTSKLETAFITQRLEFQEKGTKFRVVESARVPSRPFKPNRQFMAFAGACLGLLIGIGLVFLAEMTDHSFTEINQLRNFLNIPVVASISQILTIEEAEEIRARRRFWILSLIAFVLFSVLGGLFKYIVSKKA